MSPRTPIGDTEPVADVYAGDEDLLRGVSPAGERVDVMFLIESDPDPDALSRIAGTVGLANQAPHAGRIGLTASGQLEITLALRAVPSTTAELIQRKLAQLTCVTRSQVSIGPRASAQSACAAGSP